MLTDILTITIQAETCRAYQIRRIVVDSRERVFLALAHKEPDRVPIDYWATSEITAALLKKYGFATKDDLLDFFAVDLRYIEGPKYIGPKLFVREDGSQEDHFAFKLFRLNPVSQNVGGGYRFKGLDLTPVSDPYTS